MINPVINAPHYYPMRDSYACVVEYSIDGQDYAFVSLSPRALGKQEAIDSAGRMAARIIRRKLGDENYPVICRLDSAPSVHFP